MKIKAFLVKGLNQYNQYSVNILPDKESVEREAVTYGLEDTHTVEEIELEFKIIDGKAQLVNSISTWEQLDPKCKLNHDGYNPPIG